MTLLLPKPDHDAGIRAEEGSKLLRKPVFHLNRAALSYDPDSIHDVRVAIRRFQHFLHVFEQFLNRRKEKKIHRQLREVMKLSGEVRNRDIAAALLKQAGGANHSQPSMTLARQRKRWRLNYSNRSTA